MFRKLKQLPPTPETWRFARAEPKDAEDIFHIRSVIWWEAHRIYNVRKMDVIARIGEPEQGIAREHERILSPERRIEVARIGGQAVAFCAATYGDAENHIDAFYALPGSRGRGIGRLLLLQTLLGLVNKDVTLNTHVDNIRAQALYARFGFEPTGVVLDSAEKGALVFESGAIFPELELKLSAAHLPGNLQPIGAGNYFG